MLHDEKKERKIVQSGYRILCDVLWKRLSDHRLLGWILFDGFLTDTFGIPAAAVGIIMVLASIWVAINDPMMGVIADKTKTKYGKYRPYFLRVPALLTIVVVLLFCNPNLSPTGKIIWTAIFYAGYGMLRTAIEIPCNAIINAVTDQEDERRKMISAYTFVMGIFTTLTTSFALSLVFLFGGKNTSKGYMIVVGAAGILMTISCLICFFSTKEKYVVETENRPIKEQLQLLFKVTGLISTLCIWLAGYVGYNVMMGSSVYYIMYCLCRPDPIFLYFLFFQALPLYSPPCLWIYDHDRNFRYGIL